MDRFEISDEGILYQYSPSPDYKMELEIRAGTEYNKENPPNMAIWLENASLYHIKTLHKPRGLQNTSHFHIGILRGGGLGGCKKRRRIIRKGFG